MTINFNKIIWEGWTVRAFIEELEPSFNMIMNNRSHIKPFKTEQEVKDWCKDNQPYYKKSISDVNNYFINEYNQITKTNETYKS